MNDADYRTKARALLAATDKIARDAKGVCFWCGAKKCREGYCELEQLLADVPAGATVTVGAARASHPTNPPCVLTFRWSPLQRAPSPDFPDYHCGSPGCPGTAENPCAGSPAWRPKR